MLVLQFKAPGRSNLKTCHCFIGPMLLSGSGKKWATLVGYNNLHCFSLNCRIPSLAEVFISLKWMGLVGGELSPLILLSVVRKSFLWGQKHHIFLECGDIIFTTEHDRNLYAIILLIKSFWHNIAECNKNSEDALKLCDFCVWFFHLSLMLRQFIWRIWLVLFY